jgi:enterochelin esterase family protein
MAVALFGEASRAGQDNERRAKSLRARVAMNTATLLRPSLARLGFAGRAELCVVESAVLRGNPLGDPSVRELPVLLPVGHEKGPLPVILVLAGFTGRGHGYFEPHPWNTSVAQSFDRAVASGAVPPAILVMPDCFTRLGGSQYVNSTAVGRYRDHVVHEILPLVEEHFDVRPGAFAVCGKSSGGFGALHLAMSHPGLFRAAASISGDCDFESSHAPQLLAAARGLLRRKQTPAQFLAEFERTRDGSGDSHVVLDMLAMSACYAPNAAAELGYDLPIDLFDARLVPDVWRRWLAFDPYVACLEHVEALKQLELLHLECGRADEYHLQFGLRRFVRRLRELGVRHEHEEHDGGHRGIDARYAVVLAKLARLLAA